GGDPVHASGRRDQISSTLPGTQRRPARAGESTAARARRHRPAPGERQGQRIGTRALAPDHAQRPRRCAQQRDGLTRMSREQKWPDVLWIVRHGQSAANVARDAAEAAGLKEIALDFRRDTDVPLSALGEQQARALGLWFGRLPVDEQPQVVLTSTYVRAIRTA